MLVDTSANDKPKFAGVKILLVILRIKNLVKQELFCSHVNNINKKRIFHFIHVNSFTSSLLVLQLFITQLFLIIFGGTLEKSYSSQNLDTLQYSFAQGLFFFTFGPVIVTGINLIVFHRTTLFLVFVHWQKFRSKIKLKVSILFKTLERQDESYHTIFRLELLNFLLQEYSFYDEPSA